MRKHVQKHKNKIALVVIVAVIIVVIAYMKMGGEKEIEPVQQSAPVQQQQAAPQVTPVEEPSVPEGAQPLYPDLCYAQGGKPVSASVGCAAGEQNIGDVPGFKTPYVCCVK